jgi:hypothetical protein
MNVNCAQSSDMMLLAQAGELSPHEQAQLEAHVAECASCQAYRLDLGRLTHAARGALAAEEPSAAVMARLRSAVRDQAPARGLSFLRPAAQALACAAALAVAAGGIFWLADHRRPADALTDLHALVAMVSPEDAAVVGAPPEEPRAPARGAAARAAAREGQLRSLARQLLEMEGMAVEELTAEEETVTPSAVPAPTALQGRSNGASRPERCV